MTQRRVVLRLDPLILAGVLALFLLPYGIIGWMEARFDPSLRERICEGKLATHDSLHAGDSLRVAIAETEAQVWRARFGEACRLRPVQDVESCRTLVDARLAVQAQRRGR
jgi:hypothetical protein